MACCIDVDKSPEEERNGTFPIPDFERCFESGR